VHRPPQGGPGPRARRDGSTHRHRQGPSPIPGRLPCRSIHGHIATSHLTESTPGLNGKSFRSLSTDDTSNVLRMPRPKERGGIDLPYCPGAPCERCREPMQTRAVQENASRTWIISRIQNARDDRQKDCPWLRVALCVSYPMSRLAGKIESRAFSRGISELLAPAFFCSASLNGAIHWVPQVA